MVVVGSDVHKRTHTFVAVDEAGRKLGELTVKADPKGHEKAIVWAHKRFNGQLKWAIEDCRHLSARLELDLLDAGELVVRVPPKMMAEQRRTARTRGQSDPIDALAVARAALREPDLPVATHDEGSRELKLLVDRREDLVGERTRKMNRLRWHLHRIAPGDPVADPAPKALEQAKTRRQFAQWLDGRDGIDARLARDALADIDRVTPVINALERARSRSWSRTGHRSCSSCRDAQSSPRPRSLVKPLESTASLPMPSTPCTPVSRRSRSGPAALRTGCATTSLATGSSTLPCIASR